MINKTAIIKISSVLIVSMAVVIIVLWKSVSFLSYYADIKKNEIDSLELRIEILSKLNNPISDSLISVYNINPRDARIFGTIIKEYCERWNLSWKVMVASFAIETGFTFDPFSYNAKTKCRGLGQIWHKTGKEISGKLNYPWKNDVILYAPYFNIMFSCYYLAEMYLMFETTEGAISGYNMGPERYRKHKEGIEVLENYDHWNKVKTQLEKLGYE